MGKDKLLMFAVALPLFWIALMQSGLIDKLVSKIATWTSRRVAQPRSIEDAWQKHKGRLDFLMGLPLDEIQSELGWRSFSYDQTGRGRVASYFFRRSPRIERIALGRFGDRGIIETPPGKNLQGPYAP